MSRSLLASCVSVALAVLSGASTLKAQTCPPIYDCLAKRDCAISDDSRNCRKCLLRSPFGSNCIQFGNDPLCEAQKAAQNRALDLQRLQCESNKAMEMIDCKRRFEIEKARCVVIESVKGKSAPSLLEYWLHSKTTPTMRIPEVVVEKLTAEDGYDADLVRRMEVGPISEQLVVPEAFGDASIGFTIGDRVFLKAPVSADQPIRFWVKQMEMAKMYSNYGVEAIDTAVKENSRAIFSLIDAAVDRKCVKLQCQ